MNDVSTPAASVALVVGAGSGIGRATALRLAQDGHRVVAADLSADSVASLASEHEQIITLSARGYDATDPEACEAVIADTTAAVDRPDIVVSTVGWTAITPFLDETPDYWRKVVDVNLLSAIYLSAAAGRAMRGRGGSIVLTSSEAGKVGTSGESVYAATKAGVIGLVKSLAREFAREGIRVNAVAPGITETPLLKEQMGESEATLDKIVRGVPLRRLGQPEEMAAAIAFIAQDDASYITGQTLCVGGGLTMGS